MINRFIFNIQSDTVETHLSIKTVFHDKTKNRFYNSVTPALSIR